MSKLEAKREASEGGKDQSYGVEAPHAESFPSCGGGACTKLVPCPNVSIPLSGLSLLKTSDINKTNGFSDFLMDFMGVLTAVSEEITMNKQGRETRLMLLDLVDEMGSIRCVVFGDMVDNVAGFLTAPRNGLPVVIIQFAKVNTYKGQVGIQNVMNATKISWNPDIPEAIEFKNGLAVHEIETDLDGDFILLAIIDDVLQEDHWWYMSCTCMKALSFDYALPYCRDCKRVVFDMTARYRLKLLVTDGEDCIQVIMWDSDCFALFNKSCHQLLSEIKGDPTETYPSEIMDLIGQEFLFQVERKKDTVFGIDDCLRVKRVCCDSTVIAEFKAGMEEETPEKLKFAPAFSKLGGSESNACVLDLTPQCNSALTHTDCSQKSGATATSIGEESVGQLKRGG
ncbi:hypothetical protein SESBI_16167 [Sesbania bispinosa]|nr:hypothetical protein SESBI_16167 [Sesbania bispinosa]